MEKIRYGNVVRFSNDMINFGDDLYVSQAKSDCELRCFRSAIKSGMSNFSVFERTFIDTTKEMTEEICNDEYLREKYKMLKSAATSEYIFELLAW